MKEIYDLIIIGSGPAGLSAAIYAQRADLNTVVIEKEMVSGGQILNTYEVDNYPGLPGIGGFDLGMKFREHADKLGTKFIVDEVTAVETGLPDEADGRDDVKRVICKGGEYDAKAVIIATGARHQKLGAPGEDEFTGMGVSYCATCDGAFFKNKTIAVVGGGDVALEDAIFLSRLCKKVYLIHRRHELRGAKSLQNKVMETANIEIIWDSVVNSIEGSTKVESLNLMNKKTGEETRLPVDGIFLAVGIAPNTEGFENIVDLNAGGYIIAGEDGATSAPGIFAAGDVREKALRQIVTAVADGANCVDSVGKYLNGR